MKSKYLGLTFGTWTVSRVSKTTYNNYRFNLTRPTHDGAVKTISLTSKTMKKLAEGKLSIGTFLKNKEFQRQRFTSRAYRNTAWYTFPTNGSLK